MRPESLAEETTLLRGDEQKVVVEALVRDLLAEEAPGELSDLPVVFDPVYRTAELRLDGVEQSVGSGDGLPFDVSFLAGTALSSAVWIACNLMRAYRRRVTSDQAAELVSRLGNPLVSGSGVRRTKERIDEIVPAVRNLSKRLDEQGRVTRSNLRHLEGVHGGTDRGSPVTQDPPSSPTEPIKPIKTGETTGARDAELVLLVAEQPGVAGYHLLSYRLLGRGAGGEQIHSLYPPCLLKRDPASYIAEVLSEEGVGPTALHVDRLGAFLGGRLLPAALVDSLRGMAQGAATLQVISSTPAIPWEILRLKGADDGATESAPFLADAFALSQWPADGSPRMRFAAGRIAIVAPEDSGLSEVAAEVAAVEALGDRGCEVVRLPARYRAVSRALESGRFDVVHFTGHGLAPGDNPDRWVLVLEDGDRLSPIDVLGSPGRSSARPSLVLLNGCHTARNGWSLTGVGGLATAFLESGVGAVIGSHWAVADGSARAFAEHFYQFFLDGVPIAEAVRLVRRQLRGPGSEDATWLAYTVLSHPRARCLEPIEP